MAAPLKTGPQFRGRWRGAVGDEISDFSGMANLVACTYPTVNAGLLAGTVVDFAFFEPSADPNEKIDVTLANLVSVDVPLLGLRLTPGGAVNTIFGPFSIDGEASNFGGYFDGTLNFLYFSIQINAPGSQNCATLLAGQLGSMLNVNSTYTEFGNLTNVLGYGTISTSSFPIGGWQPQPPTLRPIV